MNEIDETELARVGRTIPASLAQITAEHAAQVISDWLDTNGAPAQVAQVVRDLYYFAQLGVRAETGALNPIDAEALPGLMAEAARVIEALGGTFSNGFVTTVPQPAPAWVSQRTSA